MKQKVCLKKEKSKKPSPERRENRKLVTSKRDDLCIYRIPHW